MEIAVLPDIPRLFTAFAEWGASLVFIVINRGRFQLKGTIILSVVAFGILILAQEWIGGWPLSLWSVGMFLASILITGFIYSCVKVDIKGAIYLGCRAFILAELVASLEWQLQYYFGVTQSENLLLPSLPWVLIIYGIAFFVAYVLLRTTYSPARLVEVTWSTTLSSTVIAISTFGISNVSFVSLDTPFSGSRASEIFYIRTLVDLAGFGMLHAQQVYQVQTSNAVELEATSRLLKAQHEQYLQSRSNMEEVNKKYHDLKHYITALRAEDSEENRNKYLDRLESSISDYGNQMHTGNSVLDTVLTLKQRQSKEKGISLTSVVDGSALAFMDPLDLSALVGNALDNAIESAFQLKQLDHRLIKFAVFRQEGFVMISVENYFDQQLSFSEGLPVTTKEDALNHGYGLKNMRAIVEKYEGTLSIDSENDWFSVRALLPTVDS